MSFSSPAAAAKKSTEEGISSGPDFQDHVRDSDAAAGAAAAPNQSTGEGDNPSTVGYPSYKDQVGDGAGMMRRPREPEPSRCRRPSDVPLAEATPITNTHIADEERLKLEQRNLELQVELEQHRVELERQKAENLRAVAAAAQQQQQQQQVPPTMDNDAFRPTTTTTNATIKKRWICAAVLVVLLALASAVVAGVCASGNCGGGGESKPLPATSSSSPADAPRPVAVGMTTTPRPSFRPATTILPARPSLSPAISAPVAISRPPAATVRPTADRTTILNYINSITLSGQTLLGMTFNDNDDAVTAEERAVRWIIDDDVDTVANDQYTLMVRYALATVWFEHQRQSTLTTTIPPTFGTADHAKTWIMPDVNECNWHGVECDIWTGRVDSLSLFQSNVVGRLPYDIGLLTELTILHLYGNNITGPIPTTLGKLTKLLELDLSVNQLTGTVPSSLAALTALTGLELNHNRLGGTIPAELSSLTNLTRWDLETNMLTGTLPASFTALTALTQFWFFNNTLTGSVPFCNDGDGAQPPIFTELVADCNEVSCPCCTNVC